MLRPVDACLSEARLFRLWFGVPIFPDLHGGAPFPGLCSTVGAGAGEGVGRNDDLHQRGGRAWYGQSPRRR